MPYIFALMLTFPTASFATVSPEAKKCLNRLFVTYDGISGYSSILLKTERNPRTGNVANSQKLRLSHRKPNYVKVEFLNSGLTGIKNNGMTTEYDGGRTLKVNLGNATGAGVVINRAARLVIGEGLDLYSSYSTDKEYFTLNNTSFTALIEMLKKNLDAMEKSDIGGLTTVPSSNCHLKYEPHARVETRVFSGIGEMTRTEKEMGSMAIFWVFLNLDKFESVTDFYSHFAGKKINVSASALPFELKLSDTGLPKELRFFYKGKEMASYIYEDMKANKK